MKNMKKILAWMMVLAVNASMIPVPNVVAAAPVQQKTASTKASSNVSATKKTAAQTKAEKKADAAAIKEIKAKQKAATKAAAAKTKAKKTEQKTTKGKLKNTIEKGIFQNRKQTKVSLSSYDASQNEVKEAASEVLKDNSVSKLVKISYDTQKDGTVKAVNVKTDATYMMAMDELDEINKASASPLSDEEMQQVYTDYAQLQAYYESKPDYFGVASPYFCAKDSEGKPIRALLSVADISFEDIGKSEQTSIKTVDGLIQGYYYALSSMIDGDAKYYGQQLLNVKNQALQSIKPGMSTAQKLLALNDWLGNYANFDMAYINNSMNKQTTASGDQASQLFDGVKRSSAFGVLVDRNSVCLSYTAAYNYLVQCACPEIYKNGDTWKTKDEVNGKLQPVYESDGTTVKTVDGVKQYKNTGNPTYIVDFVRIQWDSDVEMYGEKSHFNNAHFFSAVKVPNKDNKQKWYYVDSCYNDIYVECMQRNRVETDGNMTHSYFLISDSSLRSQFKGNFAYIDTLYKDVSNDTTYENNSWVTKAQGPIYTDNTYYYYVKNTSSISNNTYKQGEDLLVRRKISDGLLSGNETVLVNYNTGASDTKATGTNLVTEGYKKDNDKNVKKYPAIVHSTALYNNALYFNVDNKILKYDLSTNAITKVKEYNKVSAKQDESKKDFAGMSFNVTSDDDKDAAYTVYNHPIAGLTIKDDGKLYVSIATNYANVSDYKYEETNYNSSHVSWGSYKKGGDNDNQEFMWSANFVDTLDMSHVAGTSHDYETVTVAPTCTEDGYTEERCKTCGEIKEGTKKADGQKAAGHHYIKEKDVYYTTDDAGKKKSGTAYICTGCLDAAEKLPDGAKEGHLYAEPEYTWSDDNKECVAKTSCQICKDIKLDCLDDDQNKDNSKDITITENATLDNDEKEIKIEKSDDFNCENGGTVTYVASFNINGKTYTTPKEVTVKAGEHVYGTPKFVWTSAEDGTMTCKAVRKCHLCDKEDSQDCQITESVTKEPTCTEKGEKTYKASITLDRTEYTAEKTADVKATRHSYGQPEFKWSDDYKTCKAEFTCSKCQDVQSVDCKVTETIKKGNCQTEGSKFYTATCEFNGQKYSKDTEPIAIPAGHHEYDAKYTWSKDGKQCKAVLTCKYNDSTVTKELKGNDIKKTVVKAATCTANGTVKYTVSFEVQDETYTSSKTITLNATGHNFDKNGVCKKCKAQMLKSVADASKNMTVTWEKVSGANGYYVYRSTDGKKFSKVKTITSANTVKFNDTKANKNGQKYVYKVSAYVKKNGKATITVASKAKTGYFLTTPKLTSVKNVSGAKATVAWTTNTKASGYQIKYTIKGGKSQTITVSSAKSKSKTISKLTKKKVYTIRVRSYKTVSKTKYYSAWSSKKDINVTK